MRQIQHASMAGNSNLISVRNDSYPSIRTDRQGNTPPVSHETRKEQIKFNVKVTELNAMAKKNKTKKKNALNCSQRKFVKLQHDFFFHSCVLCTFLWSERLLCPMTVNLWRWLNASCAHFHSLLTLCRSSGAGLYMTQQIFSHLAWCCVPGPLNPCRDWWDVPTTAVTRHFI